MYVGIKLIITRLVLDWSFWPVNCATGRDFIFATSEMICSRTGMSEMEKFPEIGVDSDSVYVMKN